MTYSKRGTTLTDEEHKEMIALRNAIHDLPHAVSPEKMEEFAEYLVRSIKENGG